MSEKQRCCVMVYSGGYSISRYQCSKNASVERNGKHYCGIHDPVRKKEREEKKSAERRAKWEASNKRYEKERAEADEQKRRAECFHDLLAELEHMLYIFDRGLGAGTIGRETCDKARAAITKAGGEV